MGKNKSHDENTMNGCSHHDPKEKEEAQKTPHKGRVDSKSE